MWREMEYAKQDSVNNSNGKDDSFVLEIPLNTNDDILSDSFLTFERQIKWDEGFVSKLLNRKSAATSAPPSIHPINYKDFPSSGGGVRQWLQKDSQCATMSTVCNHFN